MAMSPTMQSYQIIGTSGLDSLTLVESPPPVAGPGHVVVKINAVSLNYRDYMNILGIRGVTGPIPRVPCSDGAGEVTSVGPGVTTWHPGDRVVIPFMPSWLDGPFSQSHSAAALGGAVDGVLRQQIAIPADSLVQLPDILDFAQAATLPCAAVTAWDALMVRGQMKPGSTVLIQGTGGVSIFALQIAKHNGARILAITSSDEKAAHLQALGADATFNYKKNPDWATWVLDQTNGLGVDHIVEIGGPDTLNRSIQAARFGGHIALIGVLTGTSGEIQTVQILRKGIRLDGIYVGSRTMLADVVTFFSSSPHRPVIDSTFAFADVAAAVRRLESGSHFGKIVINVA
jgi:NADPH:quinone reductase-like Zn-dependent oxidoreductase